MTPKPTGRMRQKVRPIVVTGGCGFIGCNLADALAARGDAVVVVDSLTRAGAEENARWLKQRHGDRVSIKKADIRNVDAIGRVMAQASAVLHLAGQVAVTTSLQSPIEDFEINARGTLNILELLRTRNPDAPLVFASTNKVYGRLIEDSAILRDGGRCAPLSERLVAGVSEDTPLDLYSPYGCSKGAADQYVRDYARVFGLRSVVLRMSCIYGPRQFGTEDQGWIAHFMLQALRGEPITIYGDGCQVRDALHVGDAVAAWLRALEQIDQVAGRVFNLGGGPSNAISLRELLDAIAQMRGETPAIRFDAWRPGDQPWYVSDTRAIAGALGWSARISLAEGLRSLERWLDRRFAEQGAHIPLQEARA